MPREEAEFEELLAMYCAPVLKNIKIANMFHVSNKQFDDVKDLVQRYQNKLICFRKDVRDLLSMYIENMPYYIDFTIQKFTRFYPTLVTLIKRIYPQSLNI